MVVGIKYSTAKPWAKRLGYTRNQPSVQIRRFLDELGLKWLDMMRRCCANHASKAVHRIYQRVGIADMGVMFGG
jgi:hypothetical protein